MAFDIKRANYDQNACFDYLSSWADQLDSAEKLKQVPTIHRKTIELAKKCIVSGNLEYMPSEEAMKIVDAEIRKISRGEVRQRTKTISAKISRTFKNAIGVRVSSSHLGKELNSMHSIYCEIKKWVIVITSDGAKDPVKPQSKAIFKFLDSLSSEKRRFVFEMFKTSLEEQDLGHNIKHGFFTTRTDYLSNTVKSLNDYADSHKSTVSSKTVKEFKQYFEIDILKLGDDW